MIPTVKRRKLIQQTCVKLVYGEKSTEYANVMRDDALPPNGCFNRNPLNDYYEVLDGYTRVGGTQGALMPVTTTITDPMSRDCQYSQSTPGDKDTRCFGCTHRQQEPERTYAA